jgi:hypothetical protein
VFLGPLLSGNLATGVPLMAASITATMAFGLTLSIAWPTLRLPQLASGAEVTGEA